MALKPSARICLPAPNGGSAIGELAICQGLLLKRLRRGITMGAGRTDNIAAVLKSQGLGMDDVFKRTVTLSDTSKWSDFNTVYVRYFKAGHLPARSAMGVNGLAANAFVELECWAHAGGAKR